MKIADIYELNNIETTITNLQMQLQSLYAERVKLVSGASIPGTTTDSAPAEPAIDLSAINLDLSGGNRSPLSIHRIRHLNA